MTILVINNKGQYNHRIGRSLQYLNIPSEIVSNELSIEELEAKNPIGLILGGGPSLEGAGNSEEYIKHFDIPILGICLGHQLQLQIRKVMLKLKSISIMIKTYLKDWHRKWMFGLPIKMK